jgi:hypothetical protein
MAAAEGALRAICDAVAGSVVIEALDGESEGYPGAVRVSVGPAVISLLDLPRDVIPPSWVSSMTVHGLRRAAGLTVSQDVPGCWEGSLAAWSAAYNRAHEATANALLGHIRVASVVDAAVAAGACQSALDWAHDHPGATVVEMAQDHPEWLEWARQRGILP